MTTLGRTGPDLADVLDVVGVTVDQIHETLGSLLEGGPAYVVGSLPAGYGNRGSDLDINVFVADDTPGDVPMMFFVGDTIADIQYFAPGTPASVADNLSQQRAESGIGTYALGAAPPPKTQKRLGRWLSAMPLHQNSPALLDDTVVPTVAAALVRGALEDLVRMVAVARTVDELALPAAPVAWTRAARALHELIGRARGELFIGDKWTASKIRRLNDPLPSWHSVTDAASFDELAERYALDAARLSAAAVLSPVSGTPITIGTQQFLLSNGRLHPTAKGTAPSVADIAYGTSRITVNHAAVDCLAAGSATPERPTVPSAVGPWDPPADGPAGRERDAYWLATHGTSAAWAHAMLVEPGIEDIDAAIDAADWATAIEAAALTHLRIGFCDLATRGLAVATSEADLLLSAALWTPGVVHHLADLADPLQAGEEEAKRARRQVRDADDETLERLPFAIEDMRTPRGFFPAVRAAADLERLRERLNLGGFAWEHWGV